MAEAPQVPEVKTAAQPAKHEKYPWPEKPTLLGTRVPRLDGSVKATGQAKYSFDINRPGHASRPDPPIAAPARADRLDRSWRGRKGAWRKGGARHAEPGKNVMFQGDEVAAVAAATEEQARDALRLIKVEYEVLPHIATVPLAMRAGAPPVFKDGNIKEGEAQQAGDLDAGFAQAAHDRSRPATRRRSRRTSRSRRTAASASGRATT